MSAKRKTVLVKASEVMIAGWLAQIFGVAAYDTVVQVIEAVSETDNHAATRLLADTVLFPWIVGVPQSVMDDKMGDLVESLVCDPGTRYLIRDSNMPARSGLWLAVAAPVTGMDLMNCDLPVRGLINHFKVGDTTVCIQAVQLEACMRYGE